MIDPLHLKVLTEQAAHEAAALASCVQPAPAPPRLPPRPGPSGHRAEPGARVSLGWTGSGLRGARTNARGTLNDWGENW